MTPVYQQIIDKAMEQAAHEGYRLSRWAIVTEDAELAYETRRVWNRFACMAHQMLSLHQCSDRGVYTKRLTDDTQLCLEIVFVQYADDCHRRRLLSTELTGAYAVGDAGRDTGLVQILRSRIRRYPRLRDGGCSFSEVFVD